MGFFSSIVDRFIPPVLGKAIAKFIPFLSPILSFVSIVSTALTWLRKPDEPEFNIDTTAENIARGILLNKTAANGQIPVIYGTRKVGGTLAFLETSGTDNQYLYMALILGEGEIDDITKIFVNDNEVTFDGDLADNVQRDVASSDTNYFKDSASLIKVEPHFGSDSQTTSSLLDTLTSWTSNHRLRGISYLALRFEWNSDAFGSIPTVNAIVKGKKVYNPNLDGTKTGGSGSHREDTSSTWEYSDNPIYQLLDYLRNDRYGMGIANEYFDSNYADFQTAGDICDTNITPFSGASQIDLIDSHAVIDTSQKVIDNVNKFLTGSRAFLNYHAGKYQVTVESSGSASITLTEDNIIGGIGVSSKNKNERYNRVIVTFINPDKNYQVDEAQFPPVNETGIASADQQATMKTADGGILLEGRFDMPSIANPYQAQEMAEIILRRSRSSLDVSLTADANAMELVVGDIVNITHATPSFSAKPFRVLSTTINPDCSVGLQLTEHQDSYYTFGTQQEVATIPDTTLPNPFVVQPPASITLTDELVEYSEGTVITRLNIAIGASTDKFVQYYVVEAKLSTETNFKIIGQGTELNYEMLNVIDDATYNVRCRAINSLGSSSSTITENRKIVGATEPPNDVTNFSVNMLGSSQMQLNWDANTDLDISFYEIRYQNVTNNAQWNKSVNWLQVPRTSGTTITTNVRDGAFCIKAVDKLGNESNNETIIYSNIASVTNNFKDIQTLTEDITAGTFDGDVALTDSSGTNSIVLDTKNDFDDLTGNFDSASGDFDLGGADDNIDNEGFYTLAQTLSLSGIYDTSFIKNVTIDQIEDPYDSFDDGRGVTLFDDAPAPFDGNDPTNATVQLQIASSTSSLDNATSFQPMNTSTTFKGRYFKFRLRLANKNFKTRAFVSGISVDVKMQKRQETGEDVASGTSTKSVAFGNGFFATPSIGIAAQNMATGDFFTISNKAVTGFDIDFKNSSGTNINRTFDFVAVGHGLKSSS
nr:Phage-related protein tail component [uncultured Mediterranean phage uvMED]